MSFLFKENLYIYLHYTNIYMKQTLPSVLLAILLSVLSTTASAQQKEQPAFILKSPNDTIQGFILEQKAQLNYEAISFRTEQEREYTAYKPDEIIGYGTAGSLFLTREMPAKENRKLLFLKVLVNGPVKLYYSKTAELGERYYVQKQNDTTAPLHPTDRKSVV